METNTSELLLTLRSPDSGWLAAMICALDEASRDPRFGGQQRGLLRDLLDAGGVPNAVSRAAADRLSQFEIAIRDSEASNECEADMAAACSNLTFSDTAVA
ncbi:MAG TPA: hypothetical protein VFG55_04890 [Rhodanobacteraceae bacterium]|nr:hypothetical protein [Rhodanobacteraceae bacterium]